MIKASPVALFVFNRPDLTKRVLDEIYDYGPSRLYLCSDQGRNPEEKAIVASVREMVERTVPSRIELLRLYADENVGVLGNLGHNMIKILSCEDRCIFLEDDNLPSQDFFRYCDMMLDRFSDDDDVLWICGTNYLDEFPPRYAFDVAFTQHHFPCGFATWGRKFLRDYKVDPYGDPQAWRRFKSSFGSWSLWAQDYVANKKTEYLLKHGPRHCSWDRQMQFAVRGQGRLGIIPRHNLIENIGVDERSTHGGVSTKIEMTKRFCSTKRSSLPASVSVPAQVATDQTIERNWDRFFLLPRVERLTIFGALLIKIATFSEWFRPNSLREK